MESTILRVRVPKVLADELDRQAKTLRVGKPDLARIVFARGMMKLRRDLPISKGTSPATTGQAEGSCTA